MVELEDRLNQNSRNSSVPSSQQSLHNKAKNTSPNRKKSGKRQAAQPGHKGHRCLIHPIEDNASVEQYLPNISYTLVEHQIFKVECSWCGDKHQTELTKHLPDVQLGPNLHSLSQSK
ncbi:DUF6444 domain-containing protein [Vibrio splendidus]